MKRVYARSTERLIEAMELCDNNSMLWSNARSQCGLSNSYIYIPPELRKDVVVDTMKKLVNIRGNNKPAYNYLIDNICHIKNEVGLEYISDEELLAEIKRRGWKGCIDVIIKKQIDL